MLSDEQVASAAVKKQKKRKPAPGLLKRMWLKVRVPLAHSRVAKAVVASLMANSLRFIKLTNPYVTGGQASLKDYEDMEPGILAMWHGQHLMAPTIYPSRRPLVAMVSRSADAELNALVIERFGIEAVRGSGGRDEKRYHQKGGVSALVALKKALDAGKNVAMIADIPNGKPRDAGMGIILLARLSGRPIVPVAVATSRRKVIEKSWDKTTINLPFGHSSLVAGTPIFVAEDTDDDGMELKRLELTASLDAATAKAYQLVDGAR